MGACESCGATDWLPIDTAPKDGKAPFIAVARCPESGGQWLTFAQWDRHYDHWFSSDDGLVSPTHWMPLPPLPTADTK